MKKGLISILKTRFFIIKIVAQGKKENGLFFINGHDYDNTATFDTMRSTSSFLENTTSMNPKEISLIHHILKIKTEICQKCKMKVRKVIKVSEINNHRIAEQLMNIGQPYLGTHHRRRDTNML
jgi:hypothetical protein